MATVPPSDGKTPVRILTSVLLPAPLAPISAWTSPGRTLSAAARRATTELKFFETSWTSRTEEVSLIRLAGSEAAARPGAPVPPQRAGQHALRRAAEPTTTSADHGRSSTTAIEPASLTP